MIFEVKYEDRNMVFKHVSCQMSNGHFMRQIETRFNH